MEHLTEAAHIAVGNARISVLDIFSPLFLRGACYYRCFLHFLPLDLTAMQIPLVIFHIDFPDLTLSVNVVLVDLPWIASAQPAGGTIFAAPGATVKRRPDDLLAFFFRCIFDQN